MDLVKKLTRDTLADILLDIALFSAFTFLMVLITIALNNVLWFFVLEAVFLFFWFLFKYIWSLILIWGINYDLKRMSINELKGLADEKLLYDK